MNDQLASISVETDEDDLLQTAIDGLPSSWDTFLAMVNGREEHPKIKILWNDCNQEEGCIQRKGVCTKEESLSLSARMKKGRNPFSPNKLFHGKKKKFKKEFNKSKAKCFYYGKKGHFEKEYYERKKK